MDGSIYQFPAGGEEGLPAQVPTQIVDQVVRIEDSLCALAQLRIGDGGGEAEVEHHLKMTGYHIGCTRTAIDVGYLQ